MVFDAEAVCWGFDDPNTRYLTIDPPCELFYFLAVTRSDGEQEFIIFTPLQRDVDRIHLVHVGIFPERRGNRQSMDINFNPDVALLTNVPDISR